MLAVNNENFRKSIYYALDRVAGLACYDPYNPENFLLRTITPPNCAAAGGKDYTELGNLAQISNTDQHQLDKGLEYKATAMSELQAKGATFPVKIYMPYDTSSSGQTQLAQVVEQQLERDLGTDYIDITIAGYPPPTTLMSPPRRQLLLHDVVLGSRLRRSRDVFTDPYAIGQKY
jgi:oligopeptide transport system substrate-binding protein